MGNEKINMGRGRRESAYHDLLIQDDIEYAYDATVLIENGTNEQICERMGRYDIITETRELDVQWGNALILTRANKRPQKRLPPPFCQIKYRSGGTILGKEIYMTGNQGIQRGPESRHQRIRGEK